MDSRKGIPINDNFLHDCRVGKMNKIIRHFFNSKNEIGGACCLRLCLHGTGRIRDRTRIRPAPCKLDRLKTRPNLEFVPLTVPDFVQFRVSCVNAKQNRTNSSTRSLIRPVLCKRGLIV